MKISVAICTWNRSELLKQTLESLCDLNPPNSDDWELIVVNNNSTDDTQKVLESFLDRLPLKIVFQPTQGHSISRNTAIDHADGDYIVWTDNDVIVDPNWLVAYAEAFAKFPHASFFGGQIDPVFESGMPTWIEQNWEICKGGFATRQLGDDFIELDAETLPYGANFAVKCQTQQEFPYDDEFGRIGKSMRGEDEIAVLKRIVQNGHVGIWIPGAKLKHFVPTDRSTEQYVKDYFIGQGQTNILQKKVAKNSAIAFAESWWNELIYRIKRPFVSPKHWVHNMVRSGLSWGEYQATRFVKK